MVTTERSLGRSISHARSIASWHPWGEVLRLSEGKKGRSGYAQGATQKHLGATVRGFAWPYTARNDFERPVRNKDEVLRNRAAREALAEHRAKQTVH